jgi:ABC-type glycerol-3-phosphate transport system permease component
MKPTSPWPARKASAVAEEQHNKLVSALIRLPFYLFALTMAIPYYWMVIGAFKDVPEVMQNPPSFVVLKPTLHNFYNPTYPPQNQLLGLFQQFTEVPLRFGTFFLNSVWITATVTVVSLAICSMAAYVLAKHHFPGRDAVFLVILASMMVPWQVGFIPNFLTMKTFGWINTFQALIIPALPKAFAVFFLRQNMMSVPDELIDAGRIDGASELRIWWKIALPLTGPALSAVAIFMILGEWNNFVWPLVVAQDSFHQTLPVALSRLNMVMGYPATRGVTMAAALLTSLPAVIVFLRFQRQFIESVALTGIK